VDIESADTPEFRPVQATVPLGEPVGPPARPDGPAERGGPGSAVDGPSGGPRATSELPVDVGLLGLGLIGPDPDGRPG
jgi:hypothetical protein